MGFNISTSICVLVHFVFHYIYHGESGQPLNEHQLINMDKWIH
jgi:hypothetical protein